MQRPPPNQKAFWIIFISDIIVGFAFFHNKLGVVKTGEGVLKKCGITYHPNQPFLMLPFCVSVRMFAHLHYFYLSFLC